MRRQGPSTCCASCLGSGGYGRVSDPSIFCRIIGHADIIRQWDWTYQLLASGHDGTMASGGSSPAGLIRRATIQHFELAEKGD